MHWSTKYTQYAVVIIFFIAIKLPSHASAEAESIQSLDKIEDFGVSSEVIENLNLANIRGDEGGTKLRNARAGDDDSDDSGSFVTGVWGIFLFSVLGIIALVVILAVLLYFLCGPRIKNHIKDNDRYNTETIHNQNDSRDSAFQGHDNHNFEENENANKTPDQWTQPPSEYPMQPHQISGQPLVGMVPLSHFDNNNFHSQHPGALEDQNEYYADSQMSPAPQQQYNVSEQFNNVERHTFIAPVIIPQQQQQKQQQIPTVSDHVDRQFSQEQEDYTYNDSEDRFSYLDKYATALSLPFTRADREAKETDPTGTVLPKRAVLRSSKTPYKVVEEKSLHSDDQDSGDNYYGDPYDDGAFSFHSSPPPTSIPHASHTSAFATTTQSPPPLPIRRENSNASSIGNFNPNRFVRVLPSHPPTGGLGRQTPTSPPPSGMYQW